MNPWVWPKMHFMRSQQAWTLNHHHQIQISPSLIHSRQLYQIWRNSLNAFLIMGRYEVMMTFTFDLLTPNFNQFILKFMWTLAPNLKKLSQCVLEISPSQEWERWSDGLYIWQFIRLWMVELKVFLLFALQFYLSWQDTLLILVCICFYVLYHNSEKSVYDRVNTD